MFVRNVKGFAAVLLGLGLALNASAAVTRRYLVQFKSANAFYGVAQTFAMNNSRLSMNLQDGVQPTRLFNTSVEVTAALSNLQMMVVQSNDRLLIESLKTHPDVASIEQEVFHPAPQPLATGSPGPTTAVRPSDRAPVAMPWGIAAVKAPGAWAVTKGAGARVMVLDTGIDKTHEALVTRFEKGQNFSGGDAADISDQVGHGSHVSGTILADGLNGGLVGVAPEAKVLMGKVCTAQGCSSIAIASGLDWAVKEKVDVVNMSLGGAFMTAAEGAAMAAAETAGVMVVAASGNDGKATVSYPAAASTALAVGAIDAKMAKASFSNWGPELGIVAPGTDTYSSVPKGSGRGAETKLNLDGKGLGNVNSLPMQGSPITAPATNTLVFANLGKPDDFKNIDVHGKFALISRGEIAFKDKVAEAIKNGAAGVVIYNNVAGLIQGSLTTDGSEVAVPAVMIEQTVGESAKAVLAKGQMISASLGVVKTDYATFEGTSMATPHVAGVAALVRAANKSLTPAQVRALLKKTATPLTPNDQNQMGAGLINAEAAVKQASAVSLHLL